MRLNTNQRMRGETGKSMLRFCAVDHNLTNGFVLFYEVVFYKAIAQEYI